MLIRGAANRPKRLEDLIAPALMARIDRLDLMSRKMFPGRLPGERRSKKRGQSVEFEDYRQYAPGLDIRHIDWKVYARLDRLFIKLFQEEEDLSLHIALDASASMDAGRPNKLIFAQQLAAALAYVGLVRNNRVGLTIFGSRRLRRLSESRGRRNVARLADFLLTEVDPQPGAPGEGADFSAALRSIALSRQGRGVFVLLSDFLIPEGYETGLRYLAGAGGFDTYCVQILAPGEIDPATEGDDALAAGVTGDLRLTDIETGAAAEVTISAALLKQYKATLERYCNDLHSFCTARDITHLLTRSDAEIQPLILNTLRKHGMLG
ncbi:MAG: DUF58 domain-containing protein [Planctomycetota bacterium]|nr:DUF58 domain-containing protein [Planctomycetota bacterium]